MLELADTTQTAWVNCRVATMEPDAASRDGYGLLGPRAIITEGEQIKSICDDDDAAIASCGDVIDLAGALVTPGLVDCHTHLVYAGSRSGEWEARLNGASYAEIAASGGGIQSTVNAVRGASTEELITSGTARLAAMAADGVTTVEIKSGYGLDYDNERKMLLAIQALKEKNIVDISPTLLAAHAVPAEFSGRAGDYMDLVCKEIMPWLWEEKLFEAVDVFCENVGFDIEQTKKLYDAAAALGIPIKGHNEQMSNIGGSVLLAGYGARALSSDHIERLDEKGAAALAASGTAATLLPGAFYFLRDTVAPPVELLRKHGVPMAVATDYNSGTSPFTSLRMAMNMACTLFRLTPAEALAGATRNAAKALGRQNVCGVIRPGLRADFAVWDVSRPADIIYEPGPGPLSMRIIGGSYVETH